MNYKKKFKNNYALWFIQKDLKLQPTSIEEKDWASNLSKLRKKEYLYSRGYLRKSLSELFNIDSLEIPLYAPPNKPPKLMNDLGYISISHCKNALLIGWSKEKIGVDLEKNNRLFDYRNLQKKYFYNSEKELISKLNGQKLINELLSLWVLKESAIKWEEGSILKDLVKWKCCKGFVINTSTKRKLFSYSYGYKSWILGIVLSSRINTENPITCVVEK